jgi:hypothetical protein
LRNRILGMALLLLPRTGRSPEASSSAIAAMSPASALSLSLRKGWRFPVDACRLSHDGAALNFQELAVTRGRCGREAGLPTRLFRGGQRFRAGWWNPLK